MIQADNEEWKTVHQPYELKFHKNQNYRMTKKYLIVWEDIFTNFMELNKDSLNDKIALDIGCGSRPCLDWFNGGDTYHLDPLLEKYQQIHAMKPYWKNKDSKNVLSQPAEIIVEDLRGKCDFIVCCNVLDHTYDWRWILINMREYCKEDATICFSTDLSSHGIGHPGIDTHEDFHKFISDFFDIVKSIPNFHNREVFYNLRRKVK